MCIIAIKFKGMDFIPAKNIKACCDNNGDGFAMAWNRDGRLNVFKTMDKNEFIAKYITTVKDLDPATTGMVIHARIATHGSKRVENCHLWTEGDIAFAHNGILSNIPARDDLTDSETFFRDYFLPVERALGWEFAIKNAKAIIGSSKFVWINARGDIYPLGDYVKEEFDGLKGKAYFSNRSYVPRNDYFSRSAFISSTPSAKHRQAGKGNGPVVIFRDSNGKAVKQNPAQGSLFAGFAPSPVK